jgi:hypothetical protein
MNKQSAVQQVVILADDFTGANDAGVSLAQAGMRVEVALEATYQSDAQALIYNSDSRAMTATAAYEKVAALTESVRLSSPAWLVKKIDSTLRGNPGAEVMAMQRLRGKGGDYRPGVSGGRAHYPRGEMPGQWRAAYRHRVCQRSENADYPCGRGRAL